MRIMSEEKKYTLEGLKKKLTVKQKNFCHEYVVDWNASRAAREAGYSKKTCRLIGNENLSKPYIEQYIDLIKDDFEMLCGISKTKQIRELHKIAYSSISQLHLTWIELNKFESLTDDQKSCIESIETKTESKLVNEELILVNYVKLKLHSKQSAIAEINKMMAYYEPEKHDIKHSGEIKTLNLVKASESRGTSKD